jgi:hypothetical protein
LGRSGGCSTECRDGRVGIGIGGAEGYGCDPGDLWRSEETKALAGVEEVRALKFGIRGGVGLGVLGAGGFFVFDSVDEAPTVEPGGEERVPPITDDTMMTVLDEIMMLDG